MKFLGLVGVLLSTSLVSAMAAHPEKLFQYEPVLSHLEGKIVEKTFYGPPGYGEDPNGDSKETQYILLLPSPISVAADATDPAERDVQEVTVVVLNFGEVPMKKFLNKAVSVDGTLFHAITGHHHTPILITATQVTPR